MPADRQVADLLTAFSARSVMLRGLVEILPRGTLGIGASVALRLFVFSLSSLEVMTRASSGRLHRLTRIRDGLFAAALSRAKILGVA